ncbi:MAG TPA: hypothetical protein VN782_00135 [Usitatibacter sp.]|nr:hypothetical protein [Usitatibacter sp.]
MAATNGRGVAAANAVMVFGILPMLAWLGLLVRSVFRVEVGEFDLSDLMFVGVAGMGAYLVTLVVAGLGAIWAAALLRRASVRARRVARVLVSLTAAMLLLPWLGVLVLVALRWLE